MAMTLQDTALTVVLIASLAAVGCDGKDRNQKRIAEATKRAAAKRAKEQPPPPPPPPPPPAKVTVASGAASVGTILPPYVADAAISADKELRDRIVLLAYKPPNRHTVKMMKTKGEAAGQALIAGIWHGNPQVRAHSVRLLAKLDVNKDGAVKHLSQVLLMDPAPTTRAAAAGAIVDLQIAALGPALIEVLRKDKDDSARANSAWALGKMRYVAARDALMLATVDDATWVRIRSCTALGRIKSKKAVHTLERALADPNGEVRKSASRSLKKLTGRTFRPRTPRLSVK